MNKVFVIEGECVPKARAKYNRFGGSYGKSFERQKAYEKKVSESLIEQGAVSTEKAVSIRIKIFKGYLKSWTKKQQREADLGVLRAVKRPDLDNYIKSVIDGSNGILFDDDSQMVHLEAMKGYSREPRVEIEVREMEHVLSIEELKELLNFRYEKIDGEITLKKEVLFDYLDKL